MIKRLLFSLLAVVAVCMQVSAQSEFKSEWNIGVGFGPTFSSLSLIPMNSRNSIKTQNALQYHGGISVRYITEKHFGLIAELNYAQMGWEGKFDEYEGFENFEHKHTLNYIEMPLLTHVYFGSDKMRFFINLGPKIGYLIGEKETMNDELKTWLETQADPENPYPFPSINHYNKEADNKIAYGITAGMGVELRTKIGYFTLEGRYYMGFGDIYKSKKGEDFSRSANREISARLTYYIKPF